jgi:hypothetical protein
MTPLFIGGEDIDFPAGSAAVADVGAGKFRSTWAQCCLRCAAGGTIKSPVFDGGAVTSCWVTARLYSGANYSSNLAQLAFGIIKSATVKGIYVGGTTANVPKLSLYKYDGTTITTLASEAGTSIGNATLYRLDMQIANFGSSATVNVYLDGALLITWTGDASLSGITDLDTVANTTPASSINGGFSISEVMVSASDIRNILGIKTMALTSFGTTHAWTGAAFSDINAVSFVDTTPHNTNTVDQEQQFNVTDMPAGTFDPAAIKISARLALSAGSVPTKVALGYNNGGTVTVGPDIPVTTAYASYAQYFSAGLPALASMNALQIEAKSRA